MNFSRCCFLSSSTSTAMLIVTEKSGGMMERMQVTGKFKYKYRFNYTNLFLQNNNEIIHKIYFQLTFTKSVKTYLFTGIVQPKSY